MKKRKYTERHLCVWRCPDCTHLNTYVVCGECGEDHSADWSEYVVDTYREPVDEEYN